MKVVAGEDARKFGKMNFKDVQCLAGEKTSVVEKIYRCDNVIVIS